MSMPSSEKKESRVLRALAALATPLVLVVPFLEWIPWFETDDDRRWPVVGLVALSLVGYGASRIVAWSRARRLRELESDIRTANARLSEVEPGASLGHVSDALFTEGAWRLSVYAKRAEDEDEWLERLASASSDKDYREGAPSRILIKDSFFKEVFSSNLASGVYRGPRPSGSYRDPDEGFDLGAWIAWRDSIFGADAFVGGDNRLITRKYVWYATQDPDTKQVLVALAESAAPEGVQVDFLMPQATSAWIVMAARMAGAATRVTVIINRGVAEMGIHELS